MRQHSIRRWILAAIAFVSATLGLCGTARADAAASPPDWLSEVQTYGMVPLLPGNAAGLNLTVNGIWGGVGGSDPVLTHTDIVPAVQRRYGGDASAFVAETHAAGMLAVGFVNGLESSDALAKVLPDLPAMACRNAKGEPLGTKDMLLMCANNPRWVAEELSAGKCAIDAGVDIVHLDTPMCSAFIAGMLGGGFCTHCMATFERWLMHEYTPQQQADELGIREFDPTQIVPRLAAFQRVGPMEESAFLQDSPDARLYQAFVRCQELASYCTRKVLLDELRAYAAEHGRKTALSTNAADLGTQNAGGHWIRGLMFADLVDFFAYEQNHQYDGMYVSEVTPYPRGKWAPYTKLAYAVHGRRSPGVIHAGAMGALLKHNMEDDVTYTAWMAVQAAEAYAANGAYTVYHVEPRGMTRFRDPFWSRVSITNAFIRQHRDYYEGDLSSGSPLALLVLLNERGRTIPAVMPSYLGFALGLTETNRPFDVVFGGDGRYVKDRVTVDAFSAYRAVLIPSPIEPTPNQQRVVQEFVRSGGAVVCQEPALLGLIGDARPCPGVAGVASHFAYGNGQVYVLLGDLTPTWTGDVGADFFRDYRPEQRVVIGALGEFLHAPSVVPSRADGLVCAYPVVQPERLRMVVHLVNYDVDMDGDTVRPKHGIELAVPRPDFLLEPISATLAVPGGTANPRPIPVDCSGGLVMCTVPTLSAYAAVVIAGQA